jgi:MscS family membrane protein
LNELTRFLHQPFWGATPGRYIAFAGIVIATLLLKKPISRLIAFLSSRFATRFSNGQYGSLFRSLIRKPLERLLSVILFFYSVSFIQEPLNGIVLIHLRRKAGDYTLSAADIVDHLFFLCAIIFTTLTLSRIIDFIYRTQVELAHHAVQRERAQLLPLLKDVAKIVLWTIGFFWMLGVVFHVNIPALVTGLGIGGVAIALAAKESIENLLASFTILADKPFTIEDTVRLGSLEGKVERIGFRSTRLRSADGSLLIVPNKKLIDDSLENLSGRHARKVRLSVPVKYGLSAPDLEQLTAKLQSTVTSVGSVQPPVNITLESFAETTFQIAVVYHLPEAMEEERVQAIKGEVNKKVFAAVTASTPEKKEG